MPVSGITVNPECVSKFNELKLGRGTTKYIIFKISDDAKEIIVDDSGNEADYNMFREKLLAAKEKNGKSRPSYAIYDVEFELAEGEGKRYGAFLDDMHVIKDMANAEYDRSKIAFITYINQDDTAVKSRMIYASSRDTLKNSLNGVAMNWQANDPGELEWADVLKEASKGRGIA